MPNRNYLRGVAFERQTIADHYRMGAIEVYRTAGSHGSYDVIAIYTDRIEMIQCKTKLSKVKKETTKTDMQEWPIENGLIGYKLTKFIRRAKCSK